MLNAQLLAILRCPKCRGVVTERVNGQAAALDCGNCQLSYAIVDGIPNLLIDEAKPLPATR